MIKTNKKHILKELKKEKNISYVDKIKLIKCSEKFKPKGCTVTYFAKYTELGIVQREYFF